MNMTCHDTPSIQFQSFMYLAMSPALQHNIFVLVSDKEIYPGNNGKTYKV
jgi:hypothetical protein